MNQGLKSIAPTVGQLVEQGVVASVQPLLEGQGEALGAALDGRLSWQGLSMP